MVGFAICVALFTSRVRSIRTSQPSVVPQETDDDNDDKPDGDDGNKPGGDGDKPGGNDSRGSRQPVESSRPESRQSAV